MSDKQKIRLLRYVLAELLMALANRLPTWDHDTLAAAKAALADTK